MYNYIVQSEGSQTVLFHPKETKNLYKSDIYNKYRVQSNVKLGKIIKNILMNKANYIEIILHP